MAIRSLALFLHGEQLLAVFLGGFLVVLLVLGLLSWWIYVKTKVRHGRRAIGFASLPILLLVVMIFAEWIREGPDSGQPRVYTADQLALRIKSLPDYAHFSLSGLAFYGQKLYVGSNVGLIELQNGHPERLLVFQRRDSVVSGPWYDRADNLLWAMDDATHQLLRFDGNKWFRMPMPEPNKGTCTRGDVLAGAKFTATAKGFWMVSGGTAWQWDNTSADWKVVTTYVPDAANYTPDQVIGILPLGDKPILIFRRESLSFLIHDDSFKSDDLVAGTNPRSKPVTRIGDNFFAESWAAGDSYGVICTRDGRVLRATTELVQQVDSPGFCELAVESADSEPLVVIRGKGIFHLGKEGWSRVSTYPYAESTGEYWVHAASSTNVIAFAVDAKPVIDHSKKEFSFTRNASTTAWFLHDSKWDVIPLGN